MLDAATSRAEGCRSVINVSPIWQWQNHQPTLTHTCNAKAVRSFARIDKDRLMCRSTGCMKKRFQQHQIKCKTFLNLSIPFLLFQFSYLNSRITVYFIKSCWCIIIAPTFVTKPLSCFPQQTSRWFFSPYLSSGLTDLAESHLFLCKVFPGVHKTD